MTGISFFANRHGSGEIRGRQIAEKLGARLNPKDGYADDLCIWVKKEPPEDYPKHSYLDIVDGVERLPWLKQHQDIGVIASSLSGKRYLQEVLRRSDIQYLPQHHCNFSRIRNEVMKPLRFGLVGGNASLPPAEWMIPIKWANPSTLDEVVHCYQRMDVQIVWRGMKRQLKNSLKLVNAASFGIPTIALPEPGYEDMDGFYRKAYTQTELVGEMLKLQEEGFDQEVLLTRAEDFHIDRIAKRYEQL